jgi:hypothetical protein
MMNPRIMKGRRPYNLSSEQVFRSSLHSIRFDIRMTSALNHDSAIQIVKLRTNNGAIWNSCAGGLGFSIWYNEAHARAARQSADL